MSDAYVTLPLGDEDFSPSAPEQPGSFAPRPPPNLPHIMNNDGSGIRFDVSVTQPTKSGNGYQAYVVYKVTCKTNLEQYSSSEIIVNRRFNHFVWLHIQLLEQYPCYFIPALPDKSGIDPYFNRFDAEFIERRRWALQQFLFRLVNHPIIRTSKPLQIFFEGNEDSMKLPEEKKPSLFGSLFKDIGAPKVPKSMQDPEFAEMGLYIKELEDQLFEVHKFVERMVLRRRDFGSSLGELGLTLITMGTHEEKTGEEEAATTSKSFHDLGSCCDHLAINIQEQVKDEMEKTVFVLEEWLRIMEGAKEALRVHGATVAQSLAFMSDYEKKDRALKQGVPQGKANITESDVNEARRKVEESKQRAELLGQRLREEMMRLKRMKAVELRTLLFRFVEIQIKNGFVVTESWQRALSSVVNGIDPSALPGKTQTEGYV
uniref:PX domain-containing protein n=2 Tax=Guillardia theta TaxID=55529 RepID=A0A7S4PBR1_GUITH|mmetsp:Transcript_4760/g.17296  ORF Transcript_4760/g.17296 Transcript_4760/m.17296 type:complete len:430 (+) Transcript_4760:204-1493(+)